MTDSRDKTLMDDELDILLSYMGSKTSAANARSTYGVRPKKNLSLENHPLYMQMKLQRDFAHTAGITSPYYRKHEARAGARSILHGKPVINFASYDYLGLNGHPEIVTAVDAVVREFGTSVSASRISAGERQIHRDLETALAANYEAEDCIVFVSGHAAAVSTLATLFGPKDLIVYDAVIHNCVVVGAKLSGAARRTFPHNDLDALDALLARERDRFERVVIVSEGLFSMDGDGPDLARLVTIKQDHDALLMIDDAHGLGVLGQTGRGLFEHQNRPPHGVDLWLGTLSKTLVSCGGYVAGSAIAIDLLKHLAPGFVYSVGIPAGAAMASLKALEIMQREPHRVARVHAVSQLFLQQVRSAGFDLGSSWGFGIIPLMVGDTITTLKLSENLLENGVNAFPILPPGVPDRTARLRFFLTASHTDEEINAAFQALLASRESSAIRGKNDDLPNPAD